MHSIFNHQLQLFGRRPEDVCSTRIKSAILKNERNLAAFPKHENVRLLKCAFKNQLPFENK
jgi:hypothetical protein